VGRDRPGAGRRAREGRRKGRAGSAGRGVSSRRAYLRPDTRGARGGAYSRGPGGPVAGGGENGVLAYDRSLDYAGSPTDRRILPRVVLGVQFAPTQERLAIVRAVLDTGAEVSAIDGSFFHRVGWTLHDVTDRAMRAESIHGIGVGRPIPEYLHEVTAFVGGAQAELRLRALITPPNTLEYSVLGRSDIFEQVDITFAETDRRRYFRKRNPAALRGYP
jgi:hypothetical protein